MREFLQILMEGEGHEVELAATCDEAERACAKNQFDLVITDLKLPDGSGLDVLKAVKEHQVDAQTIMLTEESDFRLSRRMKSPRNCQVDTLR